MKTSDFKIQQRTDDHAHCEYCGATSEQEAILYVIPHKREEQACICDTCVEQNDWRIDTCGGLAMLSFVNAIQATWDDTEG